MGTESGVNGNAGAERHSIRVESSAPHKLTWRWIPADAAAGAAFEEHPEMDALRLGQDLLTIDQFANALAEGEQEILMTSYGFALVSWCETSVGKTMNILTVTTDMEVADVGIHEIEAAARERDTKAIITMGRPGWTGFLERHGYSVTPTIVARKELHDYSIS